ncbi:MAG: hypothetical protein AAGC54_13975 [Cyanobacteria bacterium P01_F01_bin.4]
MLTQSPQVDNPALSTDLSQPTATQSKATQATATQPIVTQGAVADPSVNFAVAQALASSLRKIDSRWMKASRQGERVWYQGGEPYFDMVFELADQTVCWFQMTLRGKAISWSPAGIQTAETDELEISVVDHYATSKSLYDRAVIDHAFVRLVKDILRSRPDEALFKTMHAILEEA